MWIEYITLVITVTVFHELGHLISCFKRVKGVFVGIMRMKGPVVGFVVHPLKILDILLPQVLVPVVLTLLFYTNILIVVIGIVSNVCGGIWDFLLIKKLKELNEKNPDELMDRIRKDIIGIFVKV